ncbi:hypothetical protein MYOV003v1_p0096 [Vibrio phage 207E48.1]|nr:hypothetical protein MYOV003v1_p0096 [Vibrio phage 207E48.1]
MRKVYGVATNDVEGSTYTKAYRTWSSMLERCYSAKYQAKKPSYIGCTPSSEWLLFSNFKVWFDDNYIEGYQLDKDLFIDGNKIYSAATCFFVPPRLNSLFLDNKASRGCNMVGVSYDPDRRSKPYQDRIGKMRFPTELEAHASYISSKRQLVLNELDKYESEGIVDTRLIAAIRGRYYVEGNK